MDSTLYKGPQITPLLSSATLSQKYAENNVLSNVLKRVSTLEGALEKSKKRLKQSLSVIKQKDNEIVRLKEQIRLLEHDVKNKSNLFASVKDISTLTELTQSLQTRITAVENFLKGDPYCWCKSDAVDTEQFCQCSSGNCESPDLDLLLQQINELNYEAGEVHICQKTKQGAAFQSCQSISLTFYANGMQLEGHPFRDYSDLRTQFFIKDILDGFFPSELQCEYPRGVIFNVCDNRNETYEDDEPNTVFKGQGCRLDTKSDGSGHSMKINSLKKRRTHSNGNTSNCDESKTVKDKSHVFMSNFPISSESVATQIMQLNKDFYKRRIPDSITKNLYAFSGSGGGDGSYSMYRQSNSENFALPKITIKDGQVYNTRASDRETSKQSSGINTSRIKYLNPGAKTTDSCIQLKIRSVNDKDLFIVTMHTNEQVGKLRSYLPDDIKDCSIMHYKDNYNRIYLTDNQMTLRECGIFKNSVLVLCKQEFDNE